MCKVKSGNQIKNESDLQNLVIGLILRQRHKYMLSDIMDMVLYHSREASYNIQKNELKNIITDNLNFLIRNDKVHCMDGVYTPMSIYDYL